MKRYIKNSIDIAKTYSLDICIDIEECLSHPIAAADTIIPQHKDSILPKYRVSQKVLQVYQDLVMSTIATIRTYPELEIVSDLYQSRDSYTCYVPTMSNKIENIEIRFRLADHPPTVQPLDVNNIPKNSTKITVIIKTIMINDVAMENKLDFLMNIKEICDYLSNGNIHPLLVEI